MQDKSLYDRADDEKGLKSQDNTPLGSPKKVRPNTPKKSNMNSPLKESQSYEDSELLDSPLKPSNILNAPKKDNPKKRKRTEGLQSKLSTVKRNLFGMSDEVVENDLAEGQKLSQLEYSEEYIEQKRKKQKTDAMQKMHNLENCLDSASLNKEFERNFHLLKNDIIEKSNLVNLLLHELNDKNVLRLVAYCLEKADLSIYAEKTLIWRINQLGGLHYICLNDLLPKLIKYKNGILLNQINYNLDANSAKQCIYSLGGFEFEVFIKIAQQYLDDEKLIILLKAIIEDKDKYYLNQIYIKYAYKILNNQQCMDMISLNTISTGNISFVNQLLESKKHYQILTHTPEAFDLPFLTELYLQAAFYMQNDNNKYRHIINFISKLLDRNCSYLVNDVEESEDLKDTLLYAVIKNQDIEFFNNIEHLIIGSPVLIRTINSIIVLPDIENHDNQLVNYLKLEEWFRGSTQYGQSSFIIKYHEAVKDESISIFDVLNCIDDDLQNNKQFQYDFLKQIIDQDNIIYVDYILHVYPDIIVKHSILIQYAAEQGKLWVFEILSDNPALKYLACAKYYDEQADTYKYSLIHELYKNGCVTYDLITKFCHVPVVNQDMHLLYYIIYNDDIKSFKLFVDYLSNEILEEYLDLSLICKSAKIFKFLMNQGIEFSLDSEWACVTSGSDAEDNIINAMSMYFKIENITNIRFNKLAALIITDNIEVLQYLHERNLIKNRNLELSFEVPALHKSAEEIRYMAWFASLLMDKPMGIIKLFPEIIDQTFEAKEKAIENNMLSMSFVNENGANEFKQSAFMGLVENIYNLGGYNTYIYVLKNPSHKLHSVFKENSIKLIKSANANSVNNKNLYSISEINKVLYNILPKEDAELLGKIAITSLDIETIHRYTYIHNTNIANLYVEILRYLSLVYGISNEKILRLPLILYKECAPYLSNEDKTRVFQQISTIYNKVYGCYKLNDGHSEVIHAALLFFSRNFENDIIKNGLILPIFIQNEEKLSSMEGLFEFISLYKQEILVKKMYENVDLTSDAVKNMFQGLPSDIVNKILKLRCAVEGDYYSAYRNYRDFIENDSQKKLKREI
ncbi:MAG: hypothetical protein J0G32_03165 [Alphaproteobacteria bacterium]|nr:hypothetical protein [Alphaproteobacteria bacterium]OJV16319.1 MAG: hypothetical protein BGO27_03625 [Alphaproteobacteria bacterium 33-17]